MAIVESVTKGEVQSDGRFIRQKNRFVTPFGSGEGELPVEANRYRLVWSPVCPWAHRSVIVRRLLGLEDVISLGTLDPIRPDKPYSDWEFSTFETPADLAVSGEGVGAAETAGAGKSLLLNPQGKDPVLGIRYLSEAYKAADSEYSGRYTVPAVIDLQTGKVVNNDYFNLTRYWETEWKPFHKEGAPDLYPEDLRPEIDALNDILFHEVNNGVYKAGFAKSQEAYAEAVELVFNRLDQLEERLSHSRYLFGDQITESDVRLYVTLARFDIAYFNGFRVNLRMLRDYENLWDYARDLYQTRGFGDTTNFDAIKKHYHLCCLETNPNNILPAGPDLEAWNTPHGRELKFK